PMEVGFYETVDYMDFPQEACDINGTIYLANNNAGLWILEHDCDQDGLYSQQEISIGTDPANSDTDSDGMPDGWEVQYGLNPLSATDADQDADNDGLSNLAEYQGGTNPTSPDLSSSIPTSVSTTSPTSLPSPFSGFDPNTLRITFILAILIFLGALTLILGFFASKTSKKPNLET
ncbi:MAG: hypothetical protein ACFFBD_18090, partial [Candidatus Hodarchaeota archaeon]